MTRPIWTRPARAGLLVLTALVTIPLLLAGCGGTGATPNVASTVAAAATKAAPTAAAAVSTAAAAVPTAVAAAATKAAPTVAAAAASAGTAVAGPTAGQLADAGKTVYASNCASCHGAQGEGGSAPAVIGASIRYPSSIQTGQALFVYIGTQMPPGRGGSLSAEQNLQVTSYLLVQNGFVQPSAPLVATALGGIPLKK